ncbi:MAG TPA: hypothetical protein VK400_04105 [Pyrinomonadaceae bacterium]|nr:hypothetical protein [Pyrinomonadaceae bacterium]
MSEDFSEYKSTFWTIKYPAEWIVDVHQGGVSFYEKYGVGALQISSHSKDREVTTDDLYELIEGELPRNVSLNNVEAGDFTGLATEFKYKNHFWREWILSKRNVLLHVRYNCESEVSDVETEPIKQIINSLKFTTNDSGR